MSNAAPNLTWDDLEEQARQRTLEGHDDEVALAQELLTHLMEGTRLLEATNTTGAAQELTLLVVLSAINSLKCAFDLAFRGYYVEALSLVRNAYEYWLAGAYASCLPNQAPKLKRKNARWPEPSCMRRAVSASIAKNREESEQFRYALSKMYGYLSRFTHPSFVSLAAVIERPDRQRIGPRFDRNRLLISVDKAYRTVILLSLLPAHAFPDLERSQWSARNDELAQKVNAWRNRTIAQLEARQGDETEQKGA
jgi:hypothetical protein